MKKKAQQKRFIVLEQFLCFKCRQPTTRQKIIWIQILLAQLIFVLILLGLNEIKNNI